MNIIDEIDSDLTRASLECEQATLSTVHEFTADAGIAPLDPVSLDHLGIVVLALSHELTRRAVRRAWPGSDTSELERRHRQNLAALLVSRTSSEEPWRGGEDDSRPGFDDLCATFAQCAGEGETGEAPDLVLRGGQELAATAGSAGLSILSMWGAMQVTLMAELLDSRVGDWRSRCPALHGRE